MKTTNRRGRPEAHAEFYAQLKATPNTWVKYRDYAKTPETPKADVQAKNFVHNARRGAVKNLAPSDGVQIVSKPHGDGTYTVYARYLGRPSILA